ncbi:MAG TPA: HD domain-containing phosphohydrolase [Longimicrobiales bacterium]|nr:HD domain-containing phosphohydrolase [Longimicrobiales bacterium]
MSSENAVQARVQGDAAAPVRVQNDGFVQSVGRALVITFYAASQALRMYPLENAMVQKSIDEMHGVLRRLLDREQATELRVAGNFLFLNEVRLRQTLSDYAAFSYVIAALGRHGVGGVEFGAAMTREHLIPFLSLLLREGEGDEEAFLEFKEQLAAGVGPFIAVEGRRGSEKVEAGDEDEAKEVAKLTYFQSVNVAKEVLTDVRLGRAVSLRRVKRTVQSIVDQVLNNETSMLGMTALRDYDEYTFTHSVNVCIISVIIGQKLGLTKGQLYELGIGALFHDIGKQRIDQDILTKTGGLDDDEMEEIRRHPTEGLLSLFAIRAMGDVPYRAMLMTYEHHMKNDLTGYPRSIRSRNPTLFSRIVATADGYDAATSKRSYQQTPWPAEEVMREMRDNPARGYDPLLVKALINVTGVFPVGTLAILDTHELAVVTARNPDAKRLHQPVVKIISDARGVMLAEPVVADLSEADPETGRPRRAIIKTTDPDRYGIRVSDYFV